ncbi:MAG: PIN domain-containing protein [Spirochaetaceae bacterium]|nr:PIN domain-containing protein [Spirochaetaceae bacterium]
MESEAVLAVVKRAEQHIDEIIGSDILELEINQMTNSIKKEKVKNLYEIIKTNVKNTVEIKKISEEILKESTIRTYDSLHIASAEEGKADMFLTTDDKLLKACTRLEMKVRVLNPLKYFLEVMDYE